MRNRIDTLLNATTEATDVLERPKVTLTGFAELQGVLQQLTTALQGMKQGISPQLIQTVIPALSNGTKKNTSKLT